MHCTIVWASKGGSGKTTTTGNLAAALALTGYDVVVVDADPDGDLSHLFGIPESDPLVIRLQHLITDPGIFPPTAAVPVPLPAGSGTLRVLACDQQLEQAIVALGENDYTDLRRILDTFEDHTDLCLIDVPGARGPFVTAAFRAADSILLPIQPGDFERSAVHRALAQADTDAGYELPALGVAFVNTPLRSRALREHHLELTDAGIHVLQPHVRRASSVLRDPTRGGPAVISTPKSPVASDYRELAAAVIDRILRLGDQ
ncbi:Sporulation initiation inhibitor protein Soj [Paraconexibacter sp. AEG42_29]|uniref:Sporulation initiation inhibitor protein Soj n=1 Tax=Paraconexibacter sp. AEG42_29 TaxID=2997339 RepID=A0AAU7AWQ3_9ACTN